MKYVLVREVTANYGGEFEETIEFDSLDDMLIWYKANITVDVVGAYQVAEFISARELSARLAAFLDENALKREDILAKLTPEERKVLGV